MVLTGESLKKLRIGDCVRVIESEPGAKGAEGKVKFLSLWIYYRNGRWRLLECWKQCNFRNYFN